MGMTYSSQLLKFRFVSFLSLLFKCVFLFVHYKFNLPTGSELEWLEFSYSISLVICPGVLIRYEMGRGKRVKCQAPRQSASVRLLAPPLPSHVSLEMSVTTSKLQLPRL